MNIQKIISTHPKFPPYLRHVYKPPKELFFRGSLEFGSGIAVIGTRKMSLYGKRCIDILVPEIVNLGLAVISGLALGVDGYAHRSALEAGGRTVAVLGGGVDDRSIYPRTHYGLAKDIIKEGGCILTEYEPGTGVRKHHFPERNRIIAGLSEAVLVIEAPRKSGAMITARLALESGKDVWAVPGPIHAPGSEGVHELIKFGATPITSPEDIGHALGIEVKKKPLILSPEEVRVCDILKNGDATPDKISSKLRIEITSLSATLTGMEIRGLLRRLGDGRFSLYNASREHKI